MSKCQWDDCLENEAIIRSLTAHGTYALKDGVPETLVTGETLVNFRASVVSVDQMV